MAKEKIDVGVVDSVFDAEVAAATLDSTEGQLKTVYTDKDGNELAQGEPDSAYTKADWVARVSSMSLSIKVTPKIGNDFISVERAITVDVNTLDKEIVHGIWKNLQTQVISGVFNTLGLTLKQINDVKKGL